MVTLVIPGRNCAATLRECLASVTPLLGSSPLRRIIYVDDGSTDESAEIAATFPVDVVAGPGGGPGAARNLGWRASDTEMVWFIDSDCRARHDALSLLLPHLDDEEVGGVGGSYDNAVPESWLGTLVHEEIRVRHEKMPSDVDFLGSFNVLYRRSVLEAVGGFDEVNFNGPGRPGAEDADLAYRVVDAGFGLRFEPDSRVAHHHPTKLRRYLRSQRIHGYWRARLHLAHLNRKSGDGYAGWIDLGQPPIAVAGLAALLLAPVPGLRWVPVLAGATLVVLQVPMAWAIAGRTDWRGGLGFAALGVARAGARGLGLVHGLLTRPFRRR